MNDFDPYTIDYKKYIMTEYGLTESPSMWRADPFANDDPIVSSAEAIKIEKIGDLLGIYKRGSFNFRLYKVIEDDIIFMDLLSEDFPSVYMNHSFSEIKLNGKSGIVNHNIWESRNMRGLARHWVFDYIINEYDFMMSDKIHTPKGKIYWKKLIDEALNRKLKTGIINTNENNKFVSINNIEDIENYYGKYGEEGYQHYRLIIFFK